MAAGRTSPSQELYSRLIYGYNRQLRPVRRPDVPVRVGLGTSLVEVLGLSEVLSHITVKIWVTLVRIHFLVLKSNILKDSK